MATKSPKDRVQVRGRGEGMLCHNKAELTSQTSPLQTPLTFCACLPKQLPLPAIHKPVLGTAGSLAALMGALMGSHTNSSEDTSLLTFTQSPFTLFLVSTLSKPCHDPDTRQTHRGETD